MALALFVIQFGLAALLMPLFLGIPLPERFLWVTLSSLPIYLLAGLALRWWFGPRAMGGLVLGALLHVLLLFLMRLGMESDGTPYNHLFFGWPGFIIALVMPVIGGLLASRLPSRRPISHPATVRPALFAFLLWLSMEFALRGPVVLWLSRWTGSLRVADLLVLLIGFPLIGLNVSRYGRLRGIGPEGWEYRWQRSSILIGLLGGVLLLGLLPFSSQLDLYLFGNATSELADQAAGMLALPLWAKALLLLSNGLVVPVTEEVAWRGVIQTGLTRGWGLFAGILLTALLFTMKHLVMDGSVGRLSTLLLLSLILGLVRGWWGTGASTLAHLVMNLGATLLLLLA